MEQATYKQVHYLIKLGLDKSEAEKLTKSEASKKIKDLTLKSIEKESKTTASTTETKKKSSTKSKDKVETVSVDTKTSNYETNNKLIDMFLNCMKTNQDFLKKTKVQESKLDEFAIYIYNYAIKNKVNNGFFVDTDSKDFKELENKFVKDGFETCMSELTSSKTKIETVKTTEKPKAKTTKKTETKVVEKVAENKKLSDYEQLCLKLGL
jgi:hypothetical protein